MMLDKIVLIACSKTKQPISSRAEDLYNSHLFKLSLKYAKTLKPKKTFILSAKHHLLKPKTIIEPYNLSLNSLSISEVRTWADTVIDQLKKESNLETDQFIFLAGKQYRRFLTPSINHYEIPMQGLGIGEQLHYLKNHSLTNS